MAFKIKTISNAVEISDTVSGEILISQPARDSWFEEESLDKDLIVLYGTTSTNEDNIKKYRQNDSSFVGFPIADCVDATDTPFTKDTFRTFCYVSLGKSSASGGGESPDVEWMLSTPVFNTPVIAYQPIQAEVNSTGSANPIVISGSEPFTSYQVSSGTLPTGFSLDTSTGIISWSTGGSEISTVQVGITATNPVGTSAEYLVNISVEAPQGINQYTNDLNLYAGVRISTSNSTRSQVLLKQSFFGKTTSAGNGTMIEDSSSPIWAADNGDGTWNYLLQPGGGYTYWLFFLNSTTNPTNLANGYVSDLTTSLVNDLVAPNSQDVVSGGVTDYSTLEVSGYSSFDGTYTRMVVDMSLDGGDTFSGNAIWNQNGGYYMFVKDGASDTALVYSEFSSQWQLITKTGYDFVNNPTNNSNLGFVDFLSTLFIGSIAYENSIYQPTESSDFNYTVGATYYPSDAADIHYFTNRYYLSLGNDATLNGFCADAGGSWSFGFKLTRAWLPDGLGRPMFAREGRNWQGVRIGHSDAYSEMIFGNGSAINYDGSEVGFIPIDGFPAGAYVRCTYDDTSDIFSFYVDGVKYYDENISAYLDDSSGANSLDIVFGKSVASDDLANTVDSNELSYWQGAIERMWIANGAVTSTDDDGTNYPTGTTHAWELDEVTGSTFAPSISSVTINGVRDTI